MLEYIKVGSIVIVAICMVLITYTVRDNVDEYGWINVDVVGSVSTN